MPAQTTLILLKPDCISRRLTGQVISRFETEGFTILGIRMLELTSEILLQHYSHIADKPFFPEVAGFMQQTPVIAIALSGDNVIDRVRDLLGPTDSTIAPKGTIRGDFGNNKMENIAHASDSPDNALTELARFFPEGGIFHR